MGNAHPFYYGTNYISNKKKVEAARTGLEQEIARIILQFEEEILNIVRDKQLHDEGIYGDGSSLGDYSSFTVAVKKIKGDKHSNVTLEDEGDFHKSFQTDYGSFELQILATDSKTDLITKQYNKGDILFITIENQEKELSEKIIRPNLVKYFKKFFG